MCTECVTLLISKMINIIVKSISYAKIVARSLRRPHSDQLCIFLKMKSEFFFVFLCFCVFASA